MCFAQREKGVICRGVCEKKEKAERERERKWWAQEDQIGAKKQLG